MDFTRLAVDAGAFINRAVQYTGETLGQAEKTELNGRLEDLLARAESTKTRTDQIISQTVVLLQPSPGARIEDLLYERLDWSAPPRPRSHEVLGEDMIQAGLEMGANTPYGSVLLKVGEAEKQIGGAERKFAQSTAIHFLAPLRTFTEGDYRIIQEERRQLVNKRLDLDICKARLRRAHEADTEAASLNANPLRSEEYVAQVSYMFSFLRVRWLKMWAQEVAQAEMELRISQCLFDRQTEITKLLLEGVSTTLDHHHRILGDFVEAQACYYAQCCQHAQDLQRQLASAPPLLCSNNNWRSAQVTDQPSTSNQATNQSAVADQPPTANQPTGTNEPPATKEPPATNQATQQPPVTKEPPATNQNTKQPPVTKEPPATNQATMGSSTTDQAAKQPI